MQLRAAKGGCWRYSQPHVTGRDQAEKGSGGKKDTYKQRVASLGLAMALYVSSLGLANEKGGSGELLLSTGEGGEVGHFLLDDFSVITNLTSTCTHPSG